MLLSKLVFLRSITARPSDRQTDRQAGLRVTPIQRLQLSSEADMSRACVLIASTSSDVERESLHGSTLSQNSTISITTLERFCSTHPCAVYGRVAIDRK